jgi:hypothetical protein
VAALERKLPILLQGQKFHLRLSTSKAEKSNMSAKGLLGITKKLMNFHSDSQQPFALVFDFSALLMDNLN